MCRGPICCKDQSGINYLHSSWNLYFCCVINLLCLNLDHMAPWVLSFQLLLLRNHTFLIYILGKIAYWAISEITFGRQTDPQCSYLGYGMTWKYLTSKFVPLSNFFGLRDEDDSANLSKSADLTSMVPTFSFAFNSGMIQLFS